jgi:hypothetical protein
MRQNAIFVRQFKLIWAVQSSRKKYFAFAVGQIICTSPRHPVPQEGRIAIVTDVGCGMRWTRKRRARKESQGGLNLVSD